MNSSSMFVGADIPRCFYATDILVPCFGLIVSFVNPFSNDTPVILLFKQPLIHHSNDSRL